MSAVYFVILAGKESCEIIGCRYWYSIGTENFWLAYYFEIM